MPVRWIDDVLKVALERMPEAIAAPAPAPAAPPPATPEAPRPH